MSQGGHKGDRAVTSLLPLTLGLVESDQGKGGWAEKIENGNKIGGRVGNRNTSKIWINQNMMIQKQKLIKSRTNFSKTNKIKNKMIFFFQIKQNMSLTLIIS